MKKHNSQRQYISFVIITRAAKCIELLMLGNKNEKRDHFIFERMPKIKWLLLNQILLKGDKTFYTICLIFLLVVSKSLSYI